MLKANKKGEKEETFMQSLSVSLRFFWESPIFFYFAIKTANLSGGLKKDCEWSIYKLVEEGQDMCVVSCGRSNI